MTDSPRTKDSSINTFAIAGGTLLAYLLSPGLFSAIYGSSPPASLLRFVGIFYAPLIWLCQHVHAVDVFYQKYFELCGA